MAATRQRITFFEDTCRNVMKRLENDPSARAGQLRIEAQGLLDVVKAWSTNAPESNERADTVAKVLDLHTRTLNHVSGDRSRR